MTVWLNLGGKQLRVILPELPHEKGTALECSVDGKKMTVDARMVAEGVLSLIADGRQFGCILDRDLDGHGVTIAGHRTSFSVADPRSLSGQNGVAAGTEGPRSVRAPMPGRIVRILAAAGDEVAENQGLIVIEAMKMQNELRSPKQGRVSRLAAEVDATVAAGDVLIVVE